MKKAVKKKATSKKRKKAGASEGLQAFLLVGLIVVFAIAISLTIISVHSTLNKKPLITISEHPAETHTQETPPDQPVVERPPRGSRTQTESQDSTTQTQPRGRNRSSQEEQGSRPERNTTERPVNRNTTERPVERNTTERPSDRNTTPTQPSDNSGSTATVVPPKSVENRGTIVFVIDDAGNNLKELEPFLTIPGPLTIAVLPGLPSSAEAARRIRAAGKEVILHQPMEAIGGQNPGPGAINSNMEEDEIRAILTRNIAEVGPVKGINNHQGSKITMDREIMQIILAFCKENNLYFLDSRTTSDTVVPAVARQMGVKFTERNVFIDNEQTKDAMLRYISGGLTRAQRNGTAVMIGHTWSPALAPLLAEQFPIYTEQGYTISTPSDIIK